MRLHLPPVPERGRWPATYPRAAWLFRSRTWMIQETVLPVLAVAAFAYSYQAMGRAAGVRRATSSSARP